MRIIKRRVVNEAIIVCDSCNKEINKSDISFRCAICKNDICPECTTVLTIDSYSKDKVGFNVFICPKCKKTLSIEDIETKTRKNRNIH